MPPDRFYDNYSFSLHFGYAPEDEYNRIKGIIGEIGLCPSNESVKLSMLLVRSVAIEAKRLGSEEIRKIDVQTNKEKIVGGIIPTDIIIAYEVLKQALELATYGIEVATFCYLVYDKIKDNFKRKRQTYTTNTIQNETLKVIKKMTADSRASKIILERYQNLSFNINKRTILSRSKKKGFIIKQSSKGKKKTSIKIKKQKRKDN